MRHAVAYSASCAKRAGVVASSSKSASASSSPSASCCGFSASCSLLLGEASSKRDDAAPRRYADAPAPASCISRGAARAYGDVSAAAERVRRRRAAGLAPTRAARYAECAFGGRRQVGNCTARLSDGRTCALGTRAFRRDDSGQLDSCVHTVRCMSRGVRCALGCGVEPPAAYACARGAARAASSSAAARDPSSTSVLAGVGGVTKCGCGGGESEGVSRSAPTPPAPCAEPGYGHPTPPGAPACASGGSEGASRRHSGRRQPQHEKLRAAGRGRCASHAAAAGDRAACPAQGTRGAVGRPAAVERCAAARARGQHTCARTRPRRRHRPATAPDATASGHAGVRPAPCRQVRAQEHGVGAPGRWRKMLADVTCTGLAARAEIGPV